MIILSFQQCDVGVGGSWVVGVSAVDSLSSVQYIVLLGLNGTAF